MTRMSPSAPPMLPLRPSPRPEVRKGDVYAVRIFDGWHICEAVRAKEYGALSAYGCAPTDLVWSALPSTALIGIVGKEDRAVPREREGKPL